MSCVLISAFIFKSVIVSSSSPILTSWLCALCELTINIIFIMLSLILNYPSLEFPVTVYKGLFIKSLLDSLDLEKHYIFIIQEPYYNAYI